ncbi:MAG: phenylalanine--tRNA ligase subunit alpha [Clostridia bacterium]|nr:phenylalanine--tRNA ligase subunit alpha [Clostridia bacterium]
MFEELKEIRDAALLELEAIKSADELSELSTSVLGRGGKLTAILRTMGKLSAEERAEMGKRANAVKQELTERFEERKAALHELAERMKIEREAIDVTLPGKRHALPMGALNPLTLVYRQIRDALVGLGFTTFGGPEIEYDEYNFTLLNLPPNHPARDMQDTFYVNDKVLLRTHTSPCEARALKTLPLPFRLVIPGRCFRVDEPDASHSPIFMQMEGLVVDRNVSLADLKGTIDAFVKAVFGENIESRLRPSYFPFTEPSAEVDISCTICGGKGCSSCKGTGWMEIMGCGITNPHEIENCGKSPDEWRAFAWGVGVDRVACLKYGISDIRLIYEGDGRFISQFK